MRRAFIRPSMLAPTCIDHRIVVANRETQRMSTFRQSQRSFPPDYVSRETLAYRLDMKVGAIDQLVKRGILPQPRVIGEALRWWWPDVDRRIRGDDLQTSSTAHDADDPYLKAINGAASDAEHQVAAARPLRDG